MNSLPIERRDLCHLRSLRQAEYAKLSGWEFAEAFGRALRKNGLGSAFAALCPGAAKYLQRNLGMFGELLWHRYLRDRRHEEPYIVENCARDARIGLWALPLEKRIES
jgi:hypothetical protein